MQAQVKAKRAKMEAMLPNIDTLVADNIRILKTPQARLPKPTAIILVGFPGTGKTTLVEELVRTYPVAVISDEAMGHFLLPYQATFLKHSQKEFLELAAATMEKLIFSRVSCIYDSNVKFADDRKIIKQLVEQAGGRLITVYLKLSKEEALRRVEQENFLVSRGEKKGFIINKDLFDYEASTTQLPTAGEDYLLYEQTNPDSLLALKDQIAIKTRP
ncbi:MAG: hypothetical protein A3F35_00315 [Candidatus Woykebacteria bacterium RIFCSPHIGHO2_12_FULL_45_10]|uniref:UDP-N-acetylglucosamine kinase n=1 Tax=Candidatus Woykebacteria bacterium RIFCSPHIGHO2_12_FULL_45_10 TaxID=1802603 RepID=A0A1G1WNP3_9BACT|nr:MAG: hypothetical protein A3F35_00315 [Candidatus Woykebacteria bacterium RIFCSPHIGHO2_12_FULL_45_10]